jgi:pimeloyl-ACP methyl ester carboxylesterase
MIPGALAARRDYGNLRMPVVIIAGDDDRLVDTDEQSARLHREIGHSTLRRIAGIGHMVHQTRTELVMSAIDEAAGRRQPTRPTREAA